MPCSNYKTSVLRNGDISLETKRSEFNRYERGFLAHVMRKNIFQDITLTGYFEGKWIRGLEHRVGCIVRRHILIRSKKGRNL